MAADNPNEQLASTVAIGEEPAHLKLVSLISDQRFQDWYKGQQIEENILRGQWYFNTPSPVPEPGPLPNPRSGLRDWS